jgi:hypothetical protein
MSYLCNIDVFEIVENKNSFSVEVSPNNSFTYYIYNYMESKQITCKRHYRKWKYKVDCRFPIALSNKYLYMDELSSCTFRFCKPFLHHCHILSKVPSCYKNQSNQSLEVQEDCKAVEKECTISHVPADILFDIVKPCRNRHLINKCNVTGTLRQSDRDIDHACQTLQNPFPPYKNVPRYKLLNVVT